MIPFASLGTTDSNRSKASTVFMIRATPRMRGKTGGSSGCMASRTPAFSAIGTIRCRNRSKVAHNCSASIAPIMGAEAPSSNR